MEALSEIDAKILSFVDRQGSASMETIKHEFPHISAVEYRVKVLATPERIATPGSSITIRKKNTSYLHKNAQIETYELTELGKREVQDYTLRKSSERKDLWLKHIWIPITVSFTTTVITNYMLPRLPKILEWLSSILSRIVSSLPPLNFKFAYCGLTIILNLDFRRSTYEWTSSQSRF